jgi:signal transduction histidine kinase
MLERHDIVSLCEDEVERTKSLAPHLTIVAMTPERLFVDVDVRAVREILGNLLENARRHAARRIEVSLEERDAVVFVRVIDDGAGLSAGNAAQAFEPFVSLDGKGGSGLGLAVSKALARAHGGELNYEDGAFVLRLGDPSGAAPD